ncbi:hypothetical protein DACRYDRAFT_95839 [Dacryopinax primogenitus]|uniref:Uncharacterized protein n=1 Tax=Dacryopinax primogenitus (strain DJM 731) TaxID=1858805 RepID=M5G8H7_DACPD|nr:uncharacterized protein DACRYDRAFT_95839 [Dacryopinax primogenitus]EJU00068.1 hypothetical protein DACRYDRAFT_95839 [Dacryopinax primogenitus]
MLEMEHLPWVSQGESKPQQQQNATRPRGEVYNPLILDLDYLSSRVCPRPAYFGHTFLCFWTGNLIENRTPTRRISGPFSHQNN